MQRRKLMALGLGLGLSLLLPPGAAVADETGYAAQVERELRRQGFTRMDVSRTWLGRVRIEAKSKTEKREVVLNPHTGEILRDYTSSLDGKPQEDLLGNDHGGNGGGSGGASSGGPGSSGSSGSSGGSGSGDHSSGGDHSGSDGGGESGDGGHSGDG